MSMGILDSLPLAPIPRPLRKKRVLLVDTSATTCDLRAGTMRQLGVEVDCAADIGEARAWWRADLYNLVLIHVEDGLGQRDQFCEDVRGANPPQQLAFFVGKPDYLANSPGASEAASLPINDDRAGWGEVRAALSADISRSIAQRWGILEASRRISAVRSLFHARTQAMRERPMPPRDMETRQPKGPATESRTLDELLTEEMR